MFDLNEIFHPYIQEFFQYYYINLIELMKLI